VTFCDIRGGYTGEGNIDTDPLFADAGNGDFHLQPGSPCIDKGDNSAPYLPSTDFEGNARIMDGDGIPGAVVDMGIYEVDENAPTIYDLTISSTTGGWVDTPGEGTFPYDCGEVVDLIAIPHPYYKFVGWTGDVADPDSSSTTVTMSDDKSVIADFVHDPSTIYVDAGATGADNGGSWLDAYTDLQDALNEAQPGYTILVAEGTYKPSVEHAAAGDRYKSFQMKKGVAIYGGFNPSAGCVKWEDRDWVNNVTILSGDIGEQGVTSDNCYNVFYHPTRTLRETAILDGFTITGGNNGMYNYDRSSPTLTNCIFSANSGNGMYNYYVSSPTLTNCIFSANSGNGMYNYYVSSPTLTNCIFSANGGGMYNNDRSSPTLTNCILWGNTTAEISNRSSSPDVTFCDIRGGYTGEGNIDADPLFVDPANGDFHLGPCSPCIDAGDNSAPKLPTHDFEGDDRIFNNLVDMGIDEATDTQTTFYNLTTSSTAGGSITTPGEGTFTYNCNAVASLVATPASCYEFAGWTGDVADPNSAITTITMNESKSVTAGFVALETYALAISSTTGGSVTTPGEGTFTYNDCGAEVDLEAVADHFYRFVNWTGDVADPNSSITSVTMDGNKSIIANFIGLIAHYEFNGDFTDSSGYDNHGTNYGA
ncbi:MAG: right-handed parallel beta-helix repeat-containing protein, partial [Chloroflexi bacterium]|nr:right-handed parallel beta-helix repeat-containing protein [Chloroflexota bacterium]